MDSPVMRPKHAAAFLDVSRATLTRWRKTQGFPQPLQLGPRSVGFLRSELEAWLARREAC